MHGDDLLYHECIFYDCGDPEDPVDASGGSGSYGRRDRRQYCSGGEHGLIGVVLGKDQSVYNEDKGKNGSRGCRNQKRKRGGAYGKDQQKRNFSIPNLMGYFRILMIPVFSWMYFTASTREDVYRAAAVVFISSVTRSSGRLGGPAVLLMVTELGKFVDPLADKLTHGPGPLSGVQVSSDVEALVALLAVKEEGYI